MRVEAIRAWAVNRREIAAHRRVKAKTEMEAGGCPGWRVRILKDDMKSAVAEMAVLDELLILMGESDE